MAKEKSKFKIKVRQTKKIVIKRKKRLKFILPIVISLLIFITAIIYFNIPKDSTSSEKNNINSKENIVVNEKNITENSNIKNSENVKEEHFEEMNFELEKNYIEDNKDNINEKIVQKIDEIKKTNDVQENIKKDEVKKDLKQKKDEATKYDDKSITTSKDKYAYDGKNKPKLVIIIDDVSTQKQKETILNIGFPITMAFLPPTDKHKNSAQIANDVPFHMIHFPMQASSAFKGPETDTLNINDSYEHIEARVKKLREWYPKAKYTNNHTGSIFTENDEAMGKLFKALEKYNFVFVDSRTSAKSFAKKYSAKYNMPYIVRNTFLDNSKDFTSIQNQLKEAIRIAKKQGYAIAIGHPHEITLKTLKESKYLLDEVELVLLNKLPYL